MVARSVVSSNTYRYGYQKQEHDDETVGGDYAFEYRIYDTRICRFLSVDLLTMKYPMLTPYQFAGNRPIDGIDLKGLEWKDANGNVLTEAQLKNVTVYILHDDDFTEQALVQYEEAVKKYGVGNVALSNTGTTTGFSEDWSKMDGDGNMQEVMIMMHGKNQSIRPGDGQQFTATGNGKTNISGSPAPNVQDLPLPKGNISKARLLLFSCHSADEEAMAHGEGDHAQGNLSGSKLPIAHAFALHFGFQSVRGTAGSVNYYSFSTTSTPKWSDNYFKPYAENGKWNTLVSAISGKGGKWKYPAKAKSTKPNTKNTPASNPRFHARE
jgi:RHS repeat-associated protein